MASKKAGKTGKKKTGTPAKKPTASKKAAGTKAGAKKAKPGTKKAAPKKAPRKAAATKKAAPAKAVGKKGGPAGKAAAAKMAKAAKPALVKKVEKAAPAAPRAPQDPAVELAQRVATVLAERGAENVSICNVTNVTSFADCFVICEAKSERQVNALARGLSETLKREGHPPHSVEGMEQSHWVLMDFTGVVAHIFYEPARQYYDLDGLWGDAPRIPFDAASAQKRAAQARRLAQELADEGSDVEHAADLDA